MAGPVTRAHALRLLYLRSTCIAAVAGLVAISGPVAAQCTQSGTVATCSGNLSAGLSIVDAPPGAPYSGTFPLSVTVQNLTSAITASGQSIGIEYRSENGTVPGTAATGIAGPALALTIAGGSTVSVSGSTVSGALMLGRGSAGGNGANATNNNAIAGNGGTGSAITLVNNGNLSALSTLVAVNRAQALGMQSYLDQLDSALPQLTLALNALDGTDTSQAAQNALNSASQQTGLGTTGSDATQLATLLQSFITTLQPLQTYYSGIPLPEEAGHTLTGALVASSIGGAGGTGGVNSNYAPGGMASLILSSGGDPGPIGRGGVGGVGGMVAVTNTGTLATTGSYTAAILATSTGGVGGAHDSSDFNSQAGNGGGGGAVTVTDSGVLSTKGTSAPGIFAQSLGGAGAEAFTAGAGGGGGTVIVNESGSVSTLGEGSYGVFAQSQGGTGPASEGSGTGGSGGAGGAATINFSGSVITNGVNANGVFASSLGGAGGTGGGGGGTGGDGGASGATTLTITSAGTVTTSGTSAIAAYAQSFGGIGGIGSDQSGFWASAGGGGNGGAGGNVTASNAGTLTTSGDYAYGLFAQAQGGAGGVGGDAAGFIAFSGAGGGGAPAGNVTASNSGTITTTGVGATALFAQSVGGAGGDGGSAGGFAALGSNGGSEAEQECLINHLCLDGGNVTATNSGTLSTSGDGAYGLFAESIGGGGGNGGASSGVFTLGGQGGAGGHGGIVTVVNSGSISVLGDDSNAIFAQSVGGGGGNGGDATSGGTAISLAIGGKGGAGGNGGLVSVTNLGSVAVNAYNTDAIFAQSVGGGGGTGGSATAVSISALVSAAITIGGSGGDGGNGGAVNISNSGSIVTQGDFSDAVAVQSVGGGGGSGGSAFSFSASAGPEFAISASVAVGGSGGAGGNGGAVTLNNSGSITTWDWDARGVFAQSVGGGGGDGGSSAAQSITASPGVTMNVDVAVGGTGGNGGAGGEVLVTNSGSVTTFGMMSSAVFAQSVGGGGGTGGDASSTSASFLSEKGATVDVSVGGNGGGGGAGGHVKVTNTGSVTALGDWANGITAQSVGGGGGTGGAGSQGDFFDGLSPPTEAPDITDEDGNINIKQRAQAKLASLQSEFDSFKSSPKAYGKNLLSSQIDKIKDGLTAKPESFGVSIGVGGRGGTAGDGGLVEVVNNGDVTSAGFMGIAIFAQSVGGGGGEGGGGNGASSSGDLNVGGGFGGGGGSAGNGGTVTVTNTGTINTFGDFGYGVLAQSVGGGGGVGGTAGGQSSGARSLSLGIGGGGGSSGNGGDVNLNQNGDVVTFGLGAIGVLAQSVGGGGGIGGGSTAANFLNVSVGGTGGAGGNGGAVNVTVNGNIATTGDLAYGVFAQSVGGGGGLAGGVTPSTYVIGVDPFGLLQINTGVPYALGNVGIGGGGGAGGNGGDVSVTTSGTITTTGAGADGIFAQSIGGGGGVGGAGGQSLPAALALTGSNGDEGTAGKITINHSGDIYAFGADADGIFAQSISGAPTVSIPNILISLAGGNPPAPTLSGLGGDISITVNGTISGGTGSGVGIFMDGGNNNTLTIGTGGHVTASSGLAIVASQGNDAIDNSGTVTGSVGLGGGSNSFLNRSGALFESGVAVNLGAGNTLTNQGTLSPLGVGHAGTTQMIGNLTQTASGILLVDADFSGHGASDMLAIQGNAALAGKVVAQANILSAVPGTYVTVLSATQITNNSVGIDDTLAVDYNLKVSATTLQVGIDSINFVPAAANLNAAQSQIGAYLQSIWHAGNAAPDIGALLSTLAGLQSPAAYGQILSALNPNPAQTQNTVGMVTSLAFASSLMSCPGAPSADQSLVEHDCVWLRATTDSSGQNDPNSASSFHATGPRIQGGWQKQLMPDWFLGLSAAYDNQAIRAGALTAIFQDQIHVGAVVKWETLPWTFAAALTYTHGWSDMSRDIPTPIGNNVAASSTAQDMLDAKLRASDLYKFDDFYLRPSADIDIYYLHAGGYSETGAGAFNVIANASDKAMASGALGLEAGWFYTTPDGLFVRPYLSAGLTAFSDGQWDMSGRFQGAGAGTPNFSLASHFPDVLARSALGLESNLGDGTLRLEYENRSGARYHDNSVSVKMEGRF